MMRPYHLVAAAPMVAAARPATVADLGGGPSTSFRAPAPNPTAGGGEMSFALRNPGNVEIDLYTVTGQRVRELARGWYGAGEHRIAWQRVGRAGEPLPSGVYLVRFKGDGLARTHKLVVLP